MKWFGKKLTKEEVKEISGIENVLYLEQFDNYIFSSLLHLVNTRITPSCFIPVK